MGVTRQTKEELHQERERQKHAPDQKRVPRRTRLPRRWRRLTGSVGFLGVCLAGILFLGLLFAPNKVGEIGFNLSEYRKEPVNTIDALLLGSSYMYASYSPMQAWETHGLTSYVVAGPEQSMNTTWATFRNCLSTQSPRVAVLELRGISFTDKATADTMTNPATGWYGSLEAAMAGRKITSWPTVFYDFFTYHSRWKSLAYKDYAATASLLLNRVEPAFYKGFVSIREATPQTCRADWEPFPIETDKLESNLPYLDAIVALAAQHNTRLVFLMTPVAYVRHFDSYLAFVQERYPEIPLLNLNDHVDTMGFDMNTDMYDSGHTNAAGARKCTLVLADYLQELGLADHREDPAYANWNSDLARYQKAVAAP